MSPMDRAKRNRWSEQIAQQIARDCLQWSENGSFLDIQRAAAIIRAGQAMAPKETKTCERCNGTGKMLIAVADTRIKCDQCQAE
jgi:hypothetical protein